jgi:hypothetical protein
MRRLFHKHKWETQPNDHDKCECGWWRLWPSGEIIRGEPGGWWHNTWGSDPEAYMSDGR